MTNDSRRDLDMITPLRWWQWMVAVKCNSDNWCIIRVSAWWAWELIITIRKPITIISISIIQQLYARHHNLQPRTTFYNYITSLSFHSTPASFNCCEYTFCSTFGNLVQLQASRFTTVSHGPTSSISRNQMLCCLTGLSRDVVPLDWT